MIYEWVLIVHLCWTSQSQKNKKKQKNVGLLVFCAKLTKLAQEFKKKKKIDGAYGAIIEFNHLI